jgi:hypothetical protein
MGTKHMKHPALYWAVYARMQDAIRYVPVQRTEEPLRVFRAVQPKPGETVTGGREGAEKYRTVWKSSVSDYRWTGPRPEIPPSLVANLAGRALGMLAAE